MGSATIFGTSCASSDPMENSVPLELTLRKPHHVVDQFIEIDRASLPDALLQHGANAFDDTSAALAVIGDTG